jgi:hypothetical protein
VNGKDVGVLEGGDGARLLLEPPDPIGALRAVRGDELDRDLSIEPGVAGPVDDAHPSRAERRQDLVGPEAGARRDRHEDRRRATLCGRVRALVPAS